MRNVIFYTVVISLTITVPRATANSITPKLESILQDLGDEDEVSVIVSLRERVDLSTFKEEKGHRLRTRLIKALKRKAHLTQKPLSLFLNKNGVRNIKRLWLINSMAFTAKAAAIDRLRDRVEIASVRLDYTLHLPETLYTSGSPAEWNINIIDAPELWNLGFTGEGIVVASMDTGVDLDHPDVNSQWRGGENSWYDPHGEYDSPYDDDGHGTQTMGIMVGGDANGTVIGVAPDANWIAVKIFDDAGDSNFSDIHLGFQWLLDPDGDPNTDDAPDVVNNSWGIRDHINECVLEFYNDIQTLKTAEIAVIFSAGNEGSAASTSVSPANYDNSFAVSSVDSANTIDLSSSRGPSPCSAQLFPTVVAPGVNIKAPDLTFGGLFLNSYAYVSGTSFAAPHVSGAMALLMEAFPTLSPAELEDALTLSAEDLGPAGADYDYGHGLINLAAAYELLESSFCSADFNHDESVDLLDLEVLTVEWLRTNCTNCRSDLSGDQKVDFYDFADFANHYKQADCP
ncbi:hypothetical protein ES703_84266 [subsurface metagenome]